MTEGETCAYSFDEFDCAQPAAVACEVACAHEHVGVEGFCFDHADYFLSRTDWLCRLCTDSVQPHDCVTTHRLASSDHADIGPPLTLTSGPGSPPGPDPTTARDPRKRAK